MALIGTIYFLFVIGLTQAPARRLDPPIPSACWFKDTDDPSRLMSVEVAAPKELRAADPISIRWKLSENADTQCKNPLFLIFSMPNRARFSGEGFFVVPPDLDGPFHLKYARDLTRVIVPVHAGQGTRSGTLNVRVFAAGEFAMSWGLIEKPTNSKRSADLFVEKPIVHTERDALRFQIVPGVPVLTVRDHFPVVGPKKTVISNSGEFEIDDYGDFYRILERATGALLLERDGKSPNFSPTSHFAAALVRDGHVAEVIDIYARRVIAEMGLNIVNGDFSRIQEFAWGSNDAFAVAGMENYGTAELLQPYIDRPPIMFSTGDLQSFAWRDTAIVVSLENASFIAYDLRPPPAEDDHCFGPENSQSLLFTIEGTELASFGGSDDSAEADPEKRRAQLRRDNPNQLIVKKCGKSNPNAQERWDLGTAVQLSHVTDVKAFPHLRVRASDQKMMPARYSGRLWRSQPNHRGAASPIVARSTEDRTTTVGGDVVTKPGDAVGGIRDFMVSRGVAIEIGQSGSVSDFGLNVDQRLGDDKRREKSLKEWKKDVVSTTPKAEELFTEEYDNCAGPGPRRIHLPNVVKAWRWTLNGKPIWLIHSHCMANNSGNSGEGNLMLLRSVGPGSTLKEILALKQLQATTANLLSERYLAVSGSGRQALIYDLAADTEKKQFSNLASGGIVTNFGVSADGSWLVHISGNGDFGLEPIETEGNSIFGKYVDDETVIYTKEGYYDSTVEGGFFVYLQIPGLVGSYPLHHLRAELYRPEIIRDALRNPKGDIPTPTSVAPPTVAVRLISKTDRLVTVQMSTAPSQDRTHVSVYRDGRLVKQVSARSSPGLEEIEIPVLENTKWITFQATDASGLESNLQTLEVGHRSRSGTLHLLSVGTDKYNGNGVNQLNYATSDARKFLKSVSAAAYRYYRQVDTQPVIADSPNMPSQVLEAVRSIVAASSDEDTFMLFFAGHGIKDDAGHYYLAGVETNLAKPETNSLSWSDLSRALTGTKARVVIFIDACHSGVIDEFVSNDDSVNVLAQAGVPLVVLAASKGRQTSIEGPKLKGGIFTSALSESITAGFKAIDTNANGTIELSELYGAIKRQVSMSTDGRQTPWIARNQMMGEVPLF